MAVRILFFLLAGAASVSGQSATGPMRHFMQTGPSPVGAIPYGNNPKAGKYVQADDARIYYEVYGNGNPLVVLHGGDVGSTYEMAQFIDSLSPVSAARCSCCRASAT